MIPYHKSGIELDQKDLNVIKTIIESGQFVKGKWTEKLEDHFERKFNVRYAIACANATSGLAIALQSYAWRDILIGLPAFTWYSTLYAVDCTKNKYRLLDIDKETLLLEQKYDYYFNDTKLDLVISVDTFGNNSYIENSDVPIIYDAAHGYGLGSLGNRGIAEVISLSYTKIITGGQGGIILTNNSDLKEDIKDAIDDYSKLPEINAYLALKSIDNFRYIQTIRKSCINSYRSMLKINYKEQKIELDSNYSVYSIILEDPGERNRIAKALDDNNIGYKIYYNPVGEDPSLSNTEYIYNRIICLPVYEELLDSSIEFICKIINESI